MAATLHLSSISSTRPYGVLGDFEWDSDAAGPRVIEPDAFDAHEPMLNSVNDYGVWAHMVRIHPHNPQLTADPLPSLNQGLIMGVQMVALATLASGTAFGPAWGSTQPPPATVVGWDTMARSQQVHPTMESPEVARYLQAVPNANIHAVRSLHDRFVDAFADAPRLEATYRFSIDHETETPRLFLTIDTYGMDLTEVMRREMALFDEIEQDPLLKANTVSHIISAV